MTQYRTYIDSDITAGLETIQSIQTNGTEYGIGISSDVVCNNISAGIITATQVNAAIVGVSTLSVGYATSAGISTYSSTAGYATSAGISTYASTAGISTTSQGLTGTPNIIVGIATVGLGTTSLPSNSQLTFELTSNTNLRIKVRGTDGILRLANITLA